MIINPYVFGGFTFTNRLNFVGAGHNLLTSPTVDLGPSVSKISTLVVTWEAGATRTLNSLTVGGNAATLRARAAGINQTHNIEIWHYTNSLSEAEIVPTWSGDSITRARIGVFFTDPSFTNQNSNGSSSASSGTSLSRDNNLYDGGYVLAATMWASDGPTVTWTNATEVYDSGRESYAIINGTTVNAFYTVSLVLSSASTNRRLLYYSAF